MITVMCCVCDRLVYRKPGHAVGISHGFCQPCLDKFCKENGLDNTEIFIPEGSIVNHESFPKECTCGGR